jgi:hypothetical protein
MVSLMCPFPMLAVWPCRLAAATVTHNPGGVPVNLYPEL